VSARSSGVTQGAHFDLDRALPLDPQIRRASLDNGLTYYVQAHRKPQQRAQLWLAVNVGSVMEDEDQRGLAHFVEHMAFNGTQHFEKMAIVNYLESIGMQFGADVNAYTSFDETVYELQVPTDDPGALDKGFDILRDWAGALSFEPLEVEKERGVVLEEWRLGRDAWTRILDKQYPVLFTGSRYAERLPIGRPEIIKGAPREALVRFYRDWYRPDLMAVVAVGDFQADDVEKKIQARFSNLLRPKEERPRRAVDVPPHPKTLVSVETDPEMPTTSLDVYNKMPHRGVSTGGDYRRFVGEQLYHSMLNARLQELGHRPDSPFLYAYSHTGNTVRSTDAFVRSAMVKEGQTERALTVLFEEVLRVEQHGFTASELDRAKKDVLRSYQQAVLEADTRDSRDIAAEAVRNFLEAEAMPGRSTELALVDRFLPTFTLQELNGLARHWGGEDSRVILASGPAKVNVPSRDALLALVRSTGSRQVAPYVDVRTEPLMTAIPKSGRLVTTRTFADLGITEWKLSNGARVVLKPTDFKNDEVLLEAISPGGTSLVSDSDFDSARFVSQLAGQSGIGNFDLVALRKALAGKVVEASMGLGELEESFSGSASSEDLTTLFQLTYLGFTALRRDPVAFQTWRATETELVRNRRLDPETAFFEDMASLLSSQHKRRMPVTLEVVERAELEKMLAIYQQRFKEAGDFTFILVGNLNLEKTRALAETYLASLPTTGRVERWHDVGVKMPPGVQKKTVFGGTEPKSFVYLTFHGSQKWSRDAENDMDMLSRVLDIRLREVLREDMSGVYAWMVDGEVSRRPREERTFTIFFGCAPENVEKLVQATFDEITAIQKHGIGGEYIGKVKAARIRERQLDLRDNRFWINELENAYRYSDDPHVILEFESLLAKVTSERVRAAAQKYLASNQYVLGVLRPKIPEKSK
jgi:zinc protease